MSSIELNSINENQDAEEIEYDTFMSIEDLIQHNSCIDNGQWITMDNGDEVLYDSSRSIYLRRRYKGD
jgi:hypothetical protein